MNTPITFNGMLAALAVVVAIVAGITAIIAIIKWITGAHDKMKAWDNYAVQIQNIEAQIKDQRTDIEAKLQEIQAGQCILTSSVLAILDGLKQQGCNGKVTQAHADLEEYLIRRGND